MATDKTPVTLMKITLIGEFILNQPLVVLFDSGTSATMINRQTISHFSNIKRTQDRLFTTTENGDMDTSKYVLINRIELLEFHPRQKLLRAFPVYIFEHEKLRYNMIVERAFCKHVSINLNFEEGITS